MLGILGGVAKTSEAVSGYRKEALPEPGHYRIVQFTKKPETVDRDYSGKDEKKEPTPLKVGNISEFLRESEFGKILAGKSRKTNKSQHGTAIYQMENELSYPPLSRGDYFYLDNMHKDHLEVFDSRGRFVQSLNLDGTVNPAKTKQGLDQKRKISI